ncbi:DUF5060 domain-containing protein [Croceivirga lutea]|uniref:DUF5060 domain-containing protein n=1 Tax=Croceivirga lutea TaxID=1775167 RepID=UPI00163AE323|nr:DUF5060 domain-containing protein [Croceivirga lutea]
MKKRNRTAVRLSVVVLVLSMLSCKKEIIPEIDGELKKWHRITLSFEGPETDELAEINPFLDYRLDVTFSHGDKRYTVPGFYAADGNASETSASTGNIWQVRFTPDDIGAWTYAVSFKKGSEIAVADTFDAAASAGFMDGCSGSFLVTDSDKIGIDNRAKGRLNYIGESYLQFEETKDYFIKLGVDAPENLLGYADFDAATNALGFLKKWEPHAKDFPMDGESYTWQEGKGKNLLGAINYLASEELNVFSFLTFNVDGDDRNIFPYLLSKPIAEYEAYASDKKNLEAWKTHFHKTRFDVSKLDQWERIFDFAETRGMFLHFKTHETETDHLMDNGVFGLEGKLYYRELIARFGHHLSMNWNLGEENNQPTEEVLKVANYVTKLDPYDHHLVMHTFPNKDDRYEEFIGDQSPLTGASLQLSAPDFVDVNPRVLKWRQKSNATGRKWALSVDEPGKANIALLPDDEDAEHNEARANALWGSLMAGAFGVEWYFGYASPNSDLTCEDFRSRDLFWDQNRHALHFFENEIPFWEMAAANELLGEHPGFCFAKRNEVYVVYLPMGTKTSSLDLGSSGELFSVQWYDPRNGGALVQGSILQVEANGRVNFGPPPKETNKDWIALVQAIKS